MSGQGVTSLDTKSGLGEASPHAKTPLQPLRAKDSASVEKPSGNPPPSQGVFTTPENDAFYKSYSYSDLNSTAQDIRLIRVFKDEHCDLIQCQFLPQSSLQNACRKYHTLSYCAGDPSKSKSILLQGIKFNVFANLDHALRQTLSVWISKYPEEECVLWADQICINQRNDAERSHQVGLMRDIYTNCRGTFISLSTADSYETSSNGLDWFRELTEACQLPETSQGRDKFWCVLEENISNSNFFEGWSSFYDLAQCPWWTRAWIRQEFICSPSATFMYHDSNILSTHTSFLLFLCRTLPSYETLVFLSTGASRSKKTRVSKEDEGLRMELFGGGMRATDSLRAIELLLHSKETWRGNEDLKKILAGSRHCRSSDPRDRIFAFLGLAHPGYDIETNYSKSNTLDAILIHTAKRILEFDRHLEILAFAVRATKTRPGVLPSWVPDWASTEILEDGDFARLPGQDKEFEHDSLGSSVLQTSMDTNNVVLRVRGLHVDTLVGHPPSMTPTNFETVFVTSHRHTVKARTSARKGDELWIIMGSRWPFILRPCNGGYMVVSETENIEHWTSERGDIHFDEILDQMRKGLKRLRIIDLC